MNLTSAEQQQVRKLLNDDRSPGMIIWTEAQADGDTYANGIVQGDQIEVVMMTIHAIDYAAKSLGMKPEQVLKKIAKFISTTKHK
ncbi:MAG: hypothetical protein IJL12_02060 [Selenomonadaceae bacterium]|nr:hypothetical protein [Selenomonadaceae bacterium]